MTLYENILRISKGEIYDKDVISSFLPSEIEVEQIILFGASSFGKSVGMRLEQEGRTVDYYVDNDSAKHGKTINNISILSIDELQKKYTENTIILICSMWCEEIASQLKSRCINKFTVIPFEVKYQLDIMNLNEKDRKSNELLLIEQLEKIKPVYDKLADQKSKETLERVLAFRYCGNLKCIKKSNFNQYEHPKVLPEPKDVIVDGGAFTGDTAEQFNRVVNSECEIHSFEPSKDNFAKLLHFAKLNPKGNVKAINKGLGHSSGKQFMVTHEATGFSNFVAPDGNEIIELDSIDNYRLQEQLEVIDLIKLDIEGFELNALKGARQTIRECKPKLQICLYHKYEDLWELPLYISEILGDTKHEFYLGHHSAGSYETVLYVKCL